MKMRRQDREIKELTDIEEIIKKCDTVRVGMVDNGMPYVVPMNFGYIDKIVYLHCANKGRKIDILANNNNVCCEWDRAHTLINGGDDACEWSMNFESVIAFGKAYIVTDIEEKKYGLDVLMSGYNGETGGLRKYDYPEAMLSMTTIIKIILNEITGKRKS